MTKDYPWGKGTPVWVRDATLNDSDKSFTVPTGKLWELLGVTATISNTATVGNRTLQMQITNGVSEVYRSPRSGNIIASAAEMVSWAWGGAGSYGQVGFVTMSTYRMILPAGYVVRVYDSAAIDAAADDLTVVLHYVEYDA